MRFGAVLGGRLPSNLLPGSLGVFGGGAHKLLQGESKRVQGESKRV